MNIESTPIAEAVWLTKDTEGVWHKVKVVINKPQLLENRWLCSIHIFWPNSSVIVRSSHGVDSIQALELGVQLYNAEKNMLSEKLGSNFHPEAELPNGS